MIFFDILVDYDVAVSGTALSRNEMWGKVDKNTKRLKQSNPGSEIELIVDDESVLGQENYKL